MGDDHTLVLTAASLPPLPLSDVMILGSSVTAATRRSSRSGSLSLPGDGFKEDGRRSRSNSKFDLIAHDDDDDQDERERGLAGHWRAGSETEDERRSRSSSLASIESGSLITSLIMEATSDGVAKGDAGEYHRASSVLFTHPPSLSSLCEFAIAKTVDLQSAVSTFLFAEAAGTPLLYSFCSSFVERNLDAVLVSHQADGVGWPAGWSGGECRRTLEGDRPWQKEVLTILRPALLSTQGTPSLLWI